MINQDKTLSCSRLAFPVKFMRRCVRETLHFLLRYQALKRLGKSLTAGHPVIRAWLMEMAGIPTLYSAGTLLRITRLSNISERMTEPARAIYEDLCRYRRNRGYWMDRQTVMKKGRK